MTTPSNECAILFVGDPHFKIKNVEYIPLFTSRIVDLVQAKKPDFVVVAGDLLDNHDRIDVEPLNLALFFIDAIRTLCRTFVLVGNHDYKNNQQFLSNHHWMNALKQWKNVTIVDDIVEYDDFLFVPYVPPGRFIEAIKTKLDEEKIKKFRVIFAHQEFYDCKMGAINSICGDKWNNEWPLVVSGHVHNKQWVGSNIYYPGSAMQHAFGQSTGNTVSLLILDNGMVEPFNKENLDYEEVDLKMPKLIIKYLSVDDIMEPLKFEISEFKKYKLVLQGTQEEFTTFKKKARYKQLLKEGFKISFKIKNTPQEMVQGNQESKKFLQVLYDKINAEKDPQLELICKKFVKV